MHILLPGLFSLLESIWAEKTETNAVTHDKTSGPHIKRDKSPKTPHSSKTKKSKKIVTETDSEGNQEGKPENVKSKKTEVVVEEEPENKELAQKQKIISKGSAPKVNEQNVARSAKLPDGSSVQISWEEYQMIVEMRQSQELLYGEGRSRRSYSAPRWDGQMQGAQGLSYSANPFYFNRASIAPEISFSRPSEKLPEDEKEQTKSRPEASISSTKEVTTSAAKENE
ncbi:hypothetical protein ENBRE01_1592 [Enteropsectra breve]|nr:hypothetical protein ENBRE01_1592 [Enteropsectra breve]